MRHKSQSCSCIAGLEPQSRLEPSPTSSFSSLFLFLLPLSRHTPLHTLPPTLIYPASALAPPLTVPIPVFPIYWNVGRLSDGAAPPGLISGGTCNRRYRSEAPADCSVGHVGMRARGRRGVGGGEGHKSISLSLLLFTSWIASDVRITRTSSRLPLHPVRLMPEHI